MNHPRTVAVVGTGPAGLYVAALLAHQGLEVLIFDPKTAWERPSGRGVPLQSLIKFPLFEGFSGGVSLEKLLWISPKGRECLHVFESPLTLCNRERLCYFLIKKARKKGAVIVQPKLQSLERQGDRWAITTEEGVFQADFLIGADGASELVRRSLKLIPTDSLAPIDECTTEVRFEVGLPLNQVGIVRFLGDSPGYFWAFPGDSATVLGCWSSSHSIHANDHFSRLERIVNELLPVKISPTTPRFMARISTFKNYNSKSIVGSNWALVGDPAGLVDSVNGEGLYDAIHSATLLALSFRDERPIPEAYLDRLKQEIIPRLWKRKMMRKILYKPFFLEWLIDRGEKVEEAKGRLIRLFLEEWDLTND